MSGWGLGATRGLFLDTLNLGGGRNAFVNVLVDGGIAGLVWWMATLVCVVAATRRFARVARWRAEMPIMAGILAALLVNSITVEGLGAVANVSSMWLVIIVGWSAAGVLSGATLTQPPSSRRLGRPSARREEVAHPPERERPGRCHSAGVVRKNAFGPLGKIPGKGILTHGEFRTDRVRRAK